MRLNRLLPLLALLAAPALLHAAGGVRAGAAAPAAPVAPPNPNAPVDKLILRDAPVDMVLDQLAEWTGRIILRPQSLQVGYITLNITRPVTKEEAIRAVESILQMNGVAVINMGDKFIKVVNTPNAGRENAELINGSVLALPPSNKIATKIFQLEFLTPQNIQAQVTQMLTQGSGQIMAFANSNFFQVTDTIANLQRVETLVNALDHPLTNLKIQPRFISLKYATASDLVQRVQALVTGGGGSIAAIATNASLSFDQRTNQLIVIATEEQFAFFKDIVDKLDIAATPSAKNRSFALKNATAATVSQTLQTLIQTAQQANQQAGQRQGGGQRGNQQGNVNQQGTNVRGAGANNATGAAAGGAAAGGAVAAGGGAAGAAAAGGAVANAAGAATTTGGSANDFSTSFGFTADARTNSIVAIGTDSDLKILGDLIDELDRPLSQVRIEVVIVDVALSDQFDSGISALGLEIRNDRLIGINGVATGFSLTGSGAVSTTSTIFGRLGQPQNWSSILGNNALSGIVNMSTTPRKGVANIISSPTIRTMHSTTASIFVGEQRPFSSGSTTANATTTTQITQLSIGISLTVSPLIGSDGTVQMLIQQGISDRAGDVTIDGNPQPIVSSRTTSATIACKSGEIIVLGGLQRSTNGKSTSMLGGVPFLGDLLGGRQRISSRNDLVFFVRPVVTDGRSDDNTAESMKQLGELDKANQKTVRDMFDLPEPAKPGDKKGTSPSASAAPPTNAAPAPAPTPSRLNSRGSR